MLLLVLYNVRSERELMATLPEGSIGCVFGVDWTLGYRITAYSAKRAALGVELFQSFLSACMACVEAGLVDGSKLFCDSSWCKPMPHATPLSTPKD